MCGEAMKSPWLAIAPLILSACTLSACSFTEGPCYRREDIEGPSGAGGGTIVPGWGGYGDVPPDPQGAEPQPVDCDLGQPEEDEPEEGRSDEPEEQGTGDKPNTCG